MNNFEYVKDLIEVHKKYSVYYLLKNSPEVWKGENFGESFNEEVFFLEAIIKHHKTIVDSKLSKMYFLDRLSRSVNFINKYLNSQNLSFDKDDKFDIEILRDTLLKRTEEIKKMNKFKKERKINMVKFQSYFKNFLLLMEKSNTVNNRHQVGCTSSGSL